MYQRLFSPRGFILLAFMICILSVSNVVRAAVPVAPTLSSPSNGANIAYGSISFRWNGVSDATNYYLQVSADASFTSIVFGQWLGNYGGVDLSGFPDNGHRYYWRVAAGNSSGNSSFSSIWSVVNGPSDLPDLPYQSSPYDGAGVSGTTITFEWLKAARASNYMLQVAADANFSSLVFNSWVGNVLGVNLSGFADNGATYYWRIAAYNPLGTTAYSYTRSLINTPSAPPVTPVQTSPLNNAKVNGTAVTFRWSPAARATDYYVQVATDAGFSGVIFGQWIGNYSGITLNGLPDNGQTFYWRLQARNTVGSSIYSLTRAVINGPSAIPVTPVLSSPANGSKASGTGVLFTWGVAARANDYRLQIALESNFATDSLVFDSWLGNYSGATINGLPDDGTPFYWRVMARNIAGSSAFTAGYYLINGPSAVPTIPVAISPINNAPILSDAVDITWQPSARASSYYLEVASDAGFVSKTFSANVGKVTTKRVQGMTKIGGFYYWRVLAINSLGSSAYSSSASFIYHGPSSSCGRAVGSGTGVISAQGHIDTCLSSASGKYYLIDISRRLNETNDPHLGWMAADAQIETHYAGIGLMEDADNSWVAANQAAGVDAQVYAAYVYDFLANSPDAQNGVNNAGSTMRSTVNVSCKSDNASYSPVTLELTYCAGVSYKPLSGALDVVGHEWGHAVTNESPIIRTGQLDYRYDSGALNEAFSDWMGTAVEHYKGESNWTIGEGILTIRNMADPLLGGQPDTYGGSCATAATCPQNWYITAGCSAAESNDWCGVHTNSGVGNKMFYLLSVGGTHATSGISVKGLGIVKAMRIAKRANLYNWSNSASYMDARNGMINAATKLYGAASNEVIQVKRAWGAVAVGTP